MKTFNLLLLIQLKEAFISYYNWFMALIIRHINIIISPWRVDKKLGVKLKYWMQKKKKVYNKLYYNKGTMCTKSLFWIIYNQKHW